MIASCLSSCLEFVSLSILTLCFSSFFGISFFLFLVSWKDLPYQSEVGLAVGLQQHISLCNQRVFLHVSRETIVLQTLLDSDFDEMSIISRPHNKRRITRKERSQWKGNTDRLCRDFWKHLQDHRWGLLSFFDKKEGLFTSVVVFSHWIRRVSLSLKRVRYEVMRTLRDDWSNWTLLTKSHERSKWKSMNVEGDETMKWTSSCQAFTCMSGMADSSGILESDERDTMMSLCSTSSVHPFTQACRITKRSLQDDQLKKTDKVDR